MPDRPSDLPDYERPPVNEVVLSLQFGSLAALKTVHVGFLWQRWRTRYPKVNEQGTLEPAFEAFPATVATSPSIRFEQLMAPPFPRYWFESEDGTELCQVQQDRLIHNWRRRAEPYPHYEHVRSRLAEDLDDFRVFVEAEKLGALVFNQAEITYINVIDLPDGRSPHATIEEVLAVWSKFAPIEGELEDVTVRARYLFRRDGAPHARLHVSVTPAVRRSDGKEVLQLEMTFRGKPAGEDRDSAFALLDEGRGVIVRSFDRMTTPEMHEHWGRKK